MSWFRIEGKMPQHAKYAPLSDAAFRLAITAGAWCAENMTDGFIPKAMVGALTRAPAGKRLTEAVSSLVNSGVWEDRGEAFEIHDYLDWNMSRDKWLAKTIAGAAGGRAKAARTASKRLAHARDSLEQKPSTTPSVPLADSDSDQRDLKSPPKDLSGSAQETPESGERTMPCPPDLKLVEAQRSALEMNNGIKSWQLDAMTADFVSRAAAGGQPRTLTNWRKTLAKAITSDWNAGKRPRRPEPEQSLGSNGKPILNGKDLGLPGF